MIDKINAGNLNTGNFVCEYRLSCISELMESGLYMFHGINRDIPAIVLNCGNGDIIIAAMPEDTECGFAISTELDIYNKTVIFKGGFLNVNDEY